MRPVHRATSVCRCTIATRVGPSRLWNTLAPRGLGSGRRVRELIGWVLGPGDNWPKIVLAFGTWVRVYRSAMTNTSLPSPGWGAPAECTLPTADRPLRVAEFDDLFATAVRSVTRESNVHATFELPAELAVAATAADLTARESQCCTFWLFTLTMAGGRVMLDVRVPPGKVAVLDALVVRAKAVSDRAPS